MRSFKVIALALVLLPTLAAAQKKEKKPNIPPVFDQARLVYVESSEGEEFKAGLPLEDRLAIADVRDALRAWGRYTFTSEREKADLIFVVRKGRPGSGAMGGDVNNSPSQPRLGGGQMGGGAQINDLPAAQNSQFPGEQRPRPSEMDMGVSDEDLLQVCQLNAKGKLARPLWVRSMQNGLNRPQILLFTQLRDAVEKAYPKAPDAAQPKP